MSTASLNKKGGEGEKVALLPPIVQGVLLWYTASLFVRHSPSIFSPSSARNPLLFPIILSLSFPISYLTVKLLANINGWNSRTQVIKGTAVGLTSALFLDGLAHGFQPSLYSSSMDLGQIVNGASTIFWGAGCFLFSSFFV